MCKYTYTSTKYEVECLLKYLLNYVIHLLKYLLNYVIHLLKYVSRHIVDIVVDIEKAIYFCCSRLSRHIFQYMCICGLNFWDLATGAL